MRTKLCSEKKQDVALFKLLFCTVPGYEVAESAYMPILKNITCPVVYRDVYYIPFCFQNWRDLGCCFLSGYHESWGAWCVYRLFLGWQWVNN